MAERETVAVLGAGGTMGLAMARNLAKAGFPVRGWNRTPERAQPLGDDGGTVVESPAEAVRGVSLLVTMLADADAVLESGRAALAQATDEVVWLQMSTIGEAGTERCLALAREHGVTLVDAPVLGTKQPAQEGKLVVLASGPAELRERLEAVFDAVGHKTLWVGDAGAGTRLKIAVNTWVLTVTEGVAEMIALAEGLDLDPRLIFAALEGGPLDLPYLRVKGKAILERDFEPMFRLALAAKDACLAVESARLRELDLPLFEAICERMSQGAREHPDQDMSATYLTSARPRV